MFSRISYVFREMWASLRRNSTLTIAAILTATVSLFLSGLTLIIQKAFDNQLATWTEGVELITYVQHDATPDQVQLIQQALNKESSVVASAKYCDIPCSLAVKDKIYAGDPQQLQAINADNIPSFFRIVPVHRDDPELLKQVTEALKGLPKVGRIVSPDEQISTIGALKGFVGVRSLIMSIVLLLAAVLLIWNAIRTAMFARRREIEVMKLVGATNWFIRLPFMLEGLIQGLIGGLLGGGALLFVNNDWTSGVRTSFSDRSGLSGFVVTGSEPWGIALAMVVLGALVGAIGSAIAASRFLDV